MRRLVTIIGARPQFIKAAAISRAIARWNDTAAAGMELEEIIVHTGQHYDANMSDVFFHELSIPRPDYHLGIGSDSHGRQTGAMLAALDGVLEKEKPDLVLVYGDTNSTLAGVLAAVKMHIPSAHVEAGLRSFNRFMPEEINRVVADASANLLFCPTQTAVENLKKEGVSEWSGARLPCYFNERVAVFAGDVMFDAHLYYRGQAEKRASILDRLGYGDAGRKFCLATVHRPANTDDPVVLQGILQSFAAIAAVGHDVVVPLHPRTRDLMGRNGMGPPAAQGPGLVRLIDPVGYLDMVALEAAAAVILTDSGGVQKEAFFLRTPCITLRDETEWTETVASGWNILAGASTDRIMEAFRQCRAAAVGTPPFAASSVPDAPFGHGRAAEKMVSLLSRYLAGMSGEQQCAARL